MKLILASPTYGPIDPLAARSVRIAVMFAARHGVEWLGDASTDRMEYGAGRNNIVRECLESFETDDFSIMWVDSDVVVEPDTFVRLAAHAKDFVTALMFQRAGRHMPLAFIWNGRLFHHLIRWPKNTLAPIDGCGFGCVITSAAMLRRISPPWFSYGSLSEDFTFCRRAAEAGFQLYLDTGIVVRHLGEPVAVGEEEYRKANAELFGQGGSNARISPAAQARDMDFCAYSAYG
jgi:hypothetical protein